MAMTRKFDAIVIGTGQSGPPLADRLTLEGFRTAIIERKHVGGTCVNTGCIPTKSRARARGETEGFMKVLVDAESRKILGVGILGIGGDEVVHAFLDVMYAGAP